MNSYKSQAIFHLLALFKQLNLDTENPYICPFDRDILSFYATKDSKTFISRCGLVG